MGTFQNSIGGLWSKKGKRVNYLSGEITVDGKMIRIMVFKNDRKTEERYPDFKIYRQETKDDSSRAE